MSQNASAKASCKVRYVMKMLLVNSFCTENGSQFNFASHPQSAKPRSVTCIYPNPPDVARPYDFQSAGWFLGVTDITESHPGKPYIASRAVIGLSDTHCADALEEGISPVSNENQYRQHASGLIHTDDSQIARSSS